MTIVVQLIPMFFIPRSLGSSFKIENCYPEERLLARSGCVTCHWQESLRAPLVKSQNTPLGDVTQGELKARSNHPVSLKLSRQKEHNITKKQ